MDLTELTKDEQNQLFMKALAHLIIRDGLDNPDIAVKAGGSERYVQNVIAGERRFSAKVKKHLFEQLGTTYLDMLLLGVDVVNDFDPHKPKDNGNDGVACSNHAGGTKQKKGFSDYAETLFYW